MKPRPPGVYVGVSRAEYDADPGFNQSRIKDFYWAPTPRHFKHDLDHPEELSQQAQTRIDIGNALDLAICAPEKFKELVRVRPAEYPAPTKSDPLATKEWAGNSTWCKRWLQDVRSVGGIPLAPESMDRVTQILLELNKHEDASKLIRICNKQVMVVAVHPRLGFRMKCLVDLMQDVREEPEWIFDNKTSERIDPVEFSQLAFDKGYHVQAAFYMDALRFLGHCSVEQFGFIVSESKPPYCVGIRTIHIDSEEAKAGRAIYEESMAKLAECIEKNSWPDYGSKWHEVKFQPYMFRRKVVGEALE